MTKAKKITQDNALDLDDKDIREQLVEMAVEQFARLLWQRCMFDQLKNKNRQKCKVSETPRLVSQIAHSS